MVQISITQGLAELKLLDKRIVKALERVKWTSVSTKNHSKIDIDTFTKNVESEYQSYLDLVKRRDLIKRAIVLANSKIGDWNGTIAEAIEQKSSIEYKKKLLGKLKTNLLESLNEFKLKERDLNNRLDKLLQGELTKDIKTNPETIQAITVSFKENNKIVHLDPLDLTKKILSLEQETDSFETNVNWVLSEANGKTLITV